MPTRTCVGCRERQEKSEMLRLVATSAGRLKLDPSQREPGRGAYVCADVRCLARAASRRAFARTLRRQVVGEPAEQLRERLQAALEEAELALRARALADGRAEKRIDDRDEDGGLTFVVVEPRCAARLEWWRAQRAGLMGPLPESVEKRRGRRGGG